MNDAIIHNIPDSEDEAMGWSSTTGPWSSSVATDVRLANKENHGNVNGKDLGSKASRDHNELMDNAMIKPDESALSLSVPNAESRKQKQTNEAAASTSRLKVSKKQLVPDDKSEEPSRKSKPSPKTVNERNDSNYRDHSVQGMARGTDRAAPKDRDKNNNAETETQSKGTEHRSKDKDTPSRQTRSAGKPDPRSISSTSTLSTSRKSTRNVKKLEEEVKIEKVTKNKRSRVVSSSESEVEPIKVAEVEEKASSSKSRPGKADKVHEVKGRNKLKKSVSIIETSEDEDDEQIEKGSQTLDQVKTQVETPQPEETSIKPSQPSIGKGQPHKPAEDLPKTTAPEAPQATTSSTQSTGVKAESQKSAQASEASTHKSKSARSTISYKSPAVCGADALTKPKYGFKIPRAKTAPDSPSTVVTGAALVAQYGSGSTSARSISGLSSRAKLPSLHENIKAAPPKKPTIKTKEKLDPNEEYLSEGELEEKRKKDALLSKYDDY